MCRAEPVAAVVVLAAQTSEVPRSVAPVVPAEEAEVQAARAVAAGRLERLVWQQTSPPAA